MHRDFWVIIGKNILEEILSKIVVSKLVQNKILSPLSTGTLPGFLRNNFITLRAKDMNAQHY